MTWRAFVGLLDDRAHIDSHGMTWEQARELLRDWLTPYLTDVCPDCRAQGTEELARLDAMEPETEFVGEVEGEDILLEPDRP